MFVLVLQVESEQIVRVDSVELDNFEEVSLVELECFVLVL